MQNKKTKQLATCVQKPATVAVRVIIPKNRKPSRVAMNIRQKRQMVIAIAPVFPIFDHFLRLLILPELKTFQFNGTFC